MRTGTQGVELSARFTRHRTQSGCDFERPASMLVDEDADIEECDRVSLQLRNTENIRFHPFLFTISDEWQIRPIEPDCPTPVTSAQLIRSGDTRSISRTISYRERTVTPGLAPRQRHGVILIALPAPDGVPLTNRPCNLIDTGTKRGPNEGLLDVLFGKPESRGDAGLSPDLERKVVVDTVVWNVAHRQ